jgi:hypothetical protein
LIPRASVREREREREREGERGRGMEGGREGRKIVLGRGCGDHGVVDARASRMVEGDIAERDIAQSVERRTVSPKVL